MEIAKKLIAEITEKRKTALASKIQRYARNQSVLSDIGVCDRQMVYSVLDWQNRQMFDEEVQARLEAGNVQEREIVALLNRCGFEVILSQMPVEIKHRKTGEVVARGKIDGMIRYEDKKIPFEIKSANPNKFNQIKQIGDFHKSAYTAKYLNQLQMYLFGMGLDEGIFIITDCLGHIKMFPIQRDDMECARLLDKLELVADAIKAKSYPERIPYSEEVCGFCPFSTECLRDVIKTPAELVIDDELIQKVCIHEEIKMYAKEYKELHEELKERFSTVPSAIIGNKYLIRNMPSKRTSYELTPEAKDEIDKIKNAYAKQNACSIMKIEPLGKEEVKEIPE